VVVGLVLNGDGFPTTHESFAGNRNDATTVDEMLGALERRTSKRSGCTVVVDSGMAAAENLQTIKARGHHYIVAARQSERDLWLAEFDPAVGFTEVIRRPSPRSPAEVKSPVMVKAGRARGAGIRALPERRPSGQGPCDPRKTPGPPAGRPGAARGAGRSRPTQTARLNPASQRPPARALSAGRTLLSHRL
jgi:hypothetical protein